VDNLPEIPKLEPPKLFEETTEISHGKNKPVRPWDLFNKNKERATKEIQQERMAVCKACPFLLFTGQCSKCGCFMEAKTRLADAECPEDKWHAVEIDTNLLSYKD
jgi:hypothetical protein